MATNSLSENINQAISDFKGVKQAIIDKGVQIPQGTPTSEYGNKISEISTGCELPSPAFGAKWSYLTPSSIYGIAVDDNDCIYSAGATGLVWKNSSDGELLWTQSSGSVVINSITYAPDGNIYVGCANKYIIKYSQDGEQLFSFNSKHSSTINTITVDNLGNIYTGSSDTTFRKFNSSGVLQWTFSKCTKAIYKILVDSENNIYTIGTEGILRKLNTSGEIIWTANFNGTCYDMAIDGEDNIYLVPQSDAYLIKVSKDGQQLWYEDNISDLSLVYSITVDSQGYIYFADSEYNLWKVSQNREVIYCRKVMYNNLKYLKCGSGGQVYAYVTGSKTNYDRTLLRLEESVDVNELIAASGGFGAFSNCEVKENNSSYMLIKAYK